MNEYDYDDSSDECDDQDDVDSSVDSGDAAPMCGPTEFFSMKDAAEAFLADVVPKRADEGPAYLKGFVEWDDLHPIRKREWRTKEAYEEQMRPRKPEPPEGWPCGYEPTKWEEGHDSLGLFARFEPKPCSICGVLGRRSSSKCNEERRQLEDAKRLGEERAKFIAGAPAEFLPAEYRWCNFDAPEMRQRVKDAKAITAMKNAVADEDVRFVTLTGPAGAGKTSLACAGWLAKIKLMLPTLPNRGHYSSSLYVSYISTLQIARYRAEAKLGEREPERMSDARNATITVIDDVGQERSSDFIAEAVRDLVFHRFERQATTYITTGIDAKAISARYGDGFARRLFERCAIKVNRAEAPRRSA